MLGNLNFYALKAVDTGFFGADLALAAAVVLVTVGAVALVSFAVRHALRQPHKSAERPRAAVTVYYSPELECFEAQLERLVNSRETAMFDAQITVVDTACSEESRAWLRALRRKLGNCFGIVEQGGADKAENAVENDRLV